MNTTDSSTNTFSPQQIKEIAISRCDFLLSIWLPGGKRQGDEYTIQNPTRSDDEHRGNFKINIRTGKWADFATPGDDRAKGDSPVSLLMYLDNLDHGAALERIGRDLGLFSGEMGVGYGIDEFVAGIAKKAACGADARGVPENIVPIPANAGDPPSTQGRRWTYLDAAGRVIGYVDRVDKPNEKKQFYPLTYWAPGGWMRKSWFGDRPPYGLDLLAARPADPVLVVEGEKAADAARRHFGEKYVCIAWPGGAAVPRLVNWRALAGREVWLLPDHDEAGLDAMRTVGECLEKIAGSVKLLAVPADKPEKWDVADEEGLSVEWLEGLEARWLKKKAPVARVFSWEKEREEPKKKAVVVQPWSPLPVPLLAQLEEEIERRAYYAHPLASRQAALAVASHATARRYRGDGGEPAFLHLGFVSSEPGIRSAYFSAIAKFVAQCGLEAETMQGRIVSERQLHNAYAAYPRQFWMPAGFDETVRLAERQHSGHLSAALDAIGQAYYGGDLKIEVDGKKSSVTQSHMAKGPALTLLASIPEKTALATFGRLDGASKIAFAFCDRERVCVKGWRDREEEPYPDALVQAMEWFRATGPIDAGAWIDTEKTTVEIDGREIVNRYADKVQRLTGRPEAASDYRVTVLRMASVIGAWAEDHRASKDIVSWCCKAEWDRVVVERDRTWGKIGDGAPNAYDKVLAVIQAAGEKGITHRNLSRQCWAYRTLVEKQGRDAQDEMIKQMEKDGVIVCEEGKGGGLFMHAIEFVDDESEE